jgi:cyanophycinase
MNPSRLPRRTALLIAMIATATCVGCTCVGCLNDARTTTNTVSNTHDQPARIDASPTCDGGPLVIVGGGGTPEEVVRRAIELAGGVDAPVVVLGQASAVSDGEGSAEMFREAGANKVSALPLNPDDDIDDRALITSARLIWFPGGSQNRLMDALREAGVLELIRERHRAGAVVGGTSAGAAVMSDPMMTGQAELDAIRRDGTTLVEGLGLWRGVIVDQHFHARRRFNRLMAAVLDRPHLVGFGIDGGTAAIVEGNRVTVMGRSSVLILDARRARVNAGAKDVPATARGVAVHVLAAGESMRF